MNANHKNDRVVYSTGQGRMCPECQKTVAQCACRQTAPSPASDNIVRISRESKGRRGKTVTVIKGVPLDPTSLVQLTKTLKTACGSGGTVKNGVIELQGEHIALVTSHLQKQGWRVKRSGG